MASIEAGLKYTPKVNDYSSRIVEMRSSIFLITAVPSNKSSMEPILITAVDCRQLAEQALLAAIQSGVWVNVTISQIENNGLHKLLVGQ